MASSAIWAQINNFDAIRLMMALLVVWSHSFAIWFGTEASEPISLIMGGTYNAGNIAVLTFFAISGFLITASWQRRRGWLSFLRSRVARIFPGYLAAILVCSFVAAPALLGHGFTIGRPEFLGLLSNFLLRNYIVGDGAVGPVNGSLWSIPFEFWCYLAVLAFGAFGIFRKKYFVPIAAVVLIGIRIWLDLTGRHPSGGRLETIIGFAYLWFTVAPPFLLGASMLLYPDRFVRNSTLLAGTIAVPLLAAHLPIAEQYCLVITRAVFPFALVYSVLYVAFAPSPRLPNVKNLGGDYSYGCYLYAFPIQRLLEHFGRGSLSFAVFVAVSLALSILAGMASWFLVEQWFLPRKKREARKSDI